MANWLVLIAVGILIYISTMAPVFPSDWEQVARALGGILVILGIVLLVLGLVGVNVGRRN